MYRKILKIKRCEGAGKESYYEKYEVSFENPKETLSGVLLKLSEENITEKDPEHEYRPLFWEHSCLQKKCGACAMVINGEPGMACDTFLNDIEEDIIEVEPLRKFPVIKDLYVDRSFMTESLKDLEVWLNEEALNTGEKIVYEASRCIQCGLCLEICPNYCVDGIFRGMAAMTQLSFVMAKMKKEEGKEMRKNYRKYVYEGCGKSLACRNVCPAGVDIENLLVRSNAAAVWNRWNSYIERNEEK